MRVLVVEDEPDLRSYLVPLLERNDFRVDAVGTGAAALAAVAERRPDVVLLDVGLPDVSGLDVCRELRRASGYLPVLMLTCLDSRDDELRGFAVHADDYLTKPVDPETLVARLRAVLRRSGAAQGNVLTVGDVDVDLRAREARRDGRSLSLTPKEFDLLAFLVQHPGQVFGKTQLLAQVWGPDYDGDSHTVESRMSRLRIALERNPNQPRHLHSRRGFGYLLSIEPREPA